MTEYTADEWANMAAGPIPEPEPAPSASPAAEPDPDPDDVVDEPVDEALSPLDVNRAFILRKAISDRVAAQVKAERDDVLARILDAMETTGANRLAVNLPDGTPVATISLVQPSEKVAVDDAKLLAWARENRPDVVETIEHPAVEAWSEQRLAPDAVAKITDGTPWADGSPVVEGEPLPFIHRSTPAPSSFRVAYARSGGQSVGEDRIVDAWLAGGLPLPLGPDLPQLGS